MKKILIFLFLPLFLFSCNNSNKPLSEAQKEKITSEVKVAVQTLFKGIETCDAQLVLASMADSPDFIATSNGMSANFKEFNGMANAYFERLKNQEGTTLSEKYIVLDENKVLYHQVGPWKMNFKDGSVRLQSPWTAQCLFIKGADGWKVLNMNESGIEKPIKGPDKPELNQIELAQQFIGKWKSEIADTLMTVEIRAYGAGLEADFNAAAGGKTLMQGKQLYGYDKLHDRIVCTELYKEMPIFVYTMKFTSPTKCEILFYDDKDFPEIAKFRFEVELPSPDTMLQTTFADGKVVRKDTFKKVK